MPDQTALLPESPLPPRHAAEVAAERGPWGGPTRRHRGARIEADERETVFGLFLQGHPMHGVNMGNRENMLPLADAWLDGKAPPPPYRWPPR